MQYPESNPNAKTDYRAMDEELTDVLKPEEPKKVKESRPLFRKRNFKPIIMCLAVAMLSFQGLSAQIQGAVSLGLQYTDNLFQLSDYDFDRYQQDHPNLTYAETMDDLQLTTRIDLEYPIHYRWWKFTPSITGILQQNLSNTDKYRQDTMLRLRVDRHYWNFTALYGYYPYIYYRHYNDTDGTGVLEKYSYARNQYRADLQIKPIDNTTVLLGIRREDFYYNQYFTEADGSVLQSRIGLRYRFPTFTVEGNYEYRSFDNDGAERMNDDDGSYDSNIYRGKVSMHPLPFKGESTRDYSWQPYLELSKEDRYFQGMNSWYGGRADHILTTKAGMNMKLTPRWNLSLDYSHLFRNVDSPNGSVVQLKEYSENRISATVKYNF